MSAPGTNPIDDADVQGLIRFGHGRLTRATWHVLRVRDPEAARAWLRSLPVTTAARQPRRPDAAVQVAFTAPGLEALGVPERIVASFSPEFVAGMAGDGSRARRLGDVGPSAPRLWRWGAGDRIPHLLVMFFATPERDAEWTRTAAGPIWDRAFEVLARLEPAELDHTEPFGFADGISQPELDWAQARTIREEEPEYTNLAALGEFVLGYTNEYGRFTERPLIDPGPGVDLPRAIDAPDKADLGRNGTYLVVRDLEQDVRGFWNFVYAHAASGSPSHALAPTTGRAAASVEPAIASGALPAGALGLRQAMHGVWAGADAARAAAAQQLAESMVGRTMSGEALAAPGPPIPGVGRTREDARLNQFTFADDPFGTRCPVGAHVRRANPRTGDFAARVHGPLSRLVQRLGLKPDRDRDRIASTRFHRILRRGRKYGPPLTPEEALGPAPPGDPERGLYFVALNANIARQFEFVQNAWLMSAAFAGLSGEDDPLIGRRTSPAGRCDAFTMPVPGGASRRVYGLPQFVTTRAGAYFFLPGVRALRYLVDVIRRE